ncbi:MULTISPECIES: pyruvoyl-dependent arginine decarboxylase [Halolamina]|uniref:arginine decarboxylase n=1 Tax=Halolamina pelagica TaxID=699431 RepID=A0A1I5PZA9_9EURY|nr:MULTISPECIES: pyruvoyl-dependent arginine decarboxylase [Halolamina]NHX35013.1 pyruvoyl-dependent arginine decarboxylase subunit alpha [Halolamina sp. R1-12]SFP39100.1 arginine decarboxylase [Halolamina pelagica]
MSSTIHVVGGAGTAPTEKAAYDAALADANLHNYNLVPVSSVVPADAEVVRVEEAPDLGPAGNRLNVVQAEASTVGPETVAAGIGWATGPGAGLFYEADAESESDVRDRLETGLDAGRALRDWTFDHEETLIERAEAAPGEHTCVVVLATYGESEPIC